MTETPEPIDEAFEIRAALRLVGRGVALALVSGLLFGLTTGYFLPDILLGIVAIFAAIYAVVPLVPAGLVLRNVLARSLGFPRHETLVVLFGLVIFGALLGLGGLAFRLGVAVFH